MLQAESAVYNNKCWGLFHHSDLLIMHHMNGTTIFQVETVSNNCGINS